MGAGVNIDFAISSSDQGCSGGVCVFRPSKPLPAIAAGSVLVDGYSQPGSRASASGPGSDNAHIVIRLDGSRIHTRGSGLSLTGSRDAVVGMSITHFHGNGIEAVNGQSDRIESNFIGVTPHGRGDGSRDDGVALIASTAANLSTLNNVGGPYPEQRNVISANGGNGITLSGQAAPQNADSNLNGNLVQGNLIGTKRNGSCCLGNENDGIGVTQEAIDMIGGLAPRYANVIGGNLGSGIELSGETRDGWAEGAFVAGNNIGRNSYTGASIPNGAGVYIHDSTIPWGCCGGLSSVMVGGLLPGEGNVIAGNTGPGVLMRAGSETNQVRAAVLSNQIYGNGGLPIDVSSTPALDCSGFTVRQSDAATCPPVITSYTPTQIGGTACGGCVVQVFLAPTNGDGPTIPIGIATVPPQCITDHDYSCAGQPESWTLSVNPQPGGWVTATSTTTSANNNDTPSLGELEGTSAYSAPVQIP
jgi:hypothetical protein